MVTISERSKTPIVQFSAATFDMFKATTQLTYSFISLQHQIDVKTKIAWDLLGRVNIK
jgi:hypothetical protein